MYEEVRHKDVLSLSSESPLIPMNQSILYTATQISSETRFQGIFLLSVDDAVDVIVDSFRRNTFGFDDLMLSVF